MNTENANAVKTAAPSLEQIREGNAYLTVGDVGSSVVTCRKLLNNKGYACNTTSTTYDTTLQGVVKDFQSAMGLTKDGLLGQATLAVLEDTQSATGWFSNGTVNITAGKLALMGFGKLVLKPANVEKLNEVCNEYGMNTKAKVRHFLAQGLIETLYGTSFVEKFNTLPSYAPFYGAGFLQLTGRKNYEAFYTYMKDVKGINDLKIIEPYIVDNYEKPAEHVAMTYPFVSAGWYWDIRVNLNEKIVQWASLSAEETVKKVTWEINRGENKLQERIEAYEKAKQIFQ